VVDTRTPGGGRPPSSAQAASRVREVWAKLGFPVSRLPEQVVISPTCGLAGTTWEYARAVMAACRDAGRRLSEE
jgi:methionine synthase II (cobalamin-independent)